MTTEAIAVGSTVSVVRAGCVFYNRFRKDCVPSGLRGIVTDIYFREKEGPFLAIEWENGERSRGYYPSRFVPITPLVVSDARENEIYYRSITEENSV